ncbi:FtsX-like permease family protein [Mucilaginibacter pallidiroseus]|uniref:FtsX-like permease family protein n=1 Tax=Mucilaginibacter pallidiroseus TaxID=2599295 RepID=A0A563UJ31_9SPHI|nr:ABC transporter permease [Mucilaginibacter pallidiroseus]TWR31377.1 FtsX-like permease family protein [Mucilaginibacter pallidiroseus]
MFKNYLKIAWRNILKHKVFSSLNAGGLALGIASFLLLMLYVTYHYSFDKQFDNINNIYLVENNQPGDGKIYTFAATPQPLAPTIKTEVPDVVRAVRTITYTAEGLLTYKNNSFKKSGMFADDGFFDIFSYKFIAGAPANALKQPNSIVITEKLAKTLFGSEDPMGKIVKRNNQLPLQVSGVIEDVPSNATFKFEFILPWIMFEDSNPWAKSSGWGSNFARTVVQLKNPGALPAANRIMKGMVGRHAEGNKNVLFLYPFSKLHLYSKFEDGKSVGGMIDQLQLFTTLAICILLIACVNFMNLSTARSEERAKEVGIRKAIGSSRSSLMGQFITESVILSMLSTIIALALVVLSLPYFNQLLGLELVLPYNKPLGWLIIAGIGVLTGLIAGSYPAFYLSAFEPIKVLKGMFKGGKSALPLRKVLVVVQFGFAVFLITATICIYKQIKFVQSKSTGYDKNNLVEIPIEGDLSKNVNVLANQLKSSGAITSATVFQQSINESGSNTWGVSWPGKRDDETILFDIFRAGEDFTKTAGVKLLQGREFSAGNPADTAGTTVLINESAQKVMKLKSPIGSIINWGDTKLTVVGVYKDFVWGSPYEKTRPMITPFANNGNSVMAMRLNPDRSITANIDAINKALKTVNPFYPPTVNFADSDFEQKFKDEKLLATLANLFGCLAIIISCFGLFGLAAYAAEQRVKEIGVRKVLGATVFDLTALLSKDFLKLVTIAIVIAIPVSIWAMNQWLQKFEYRISLSWWMMALAGLITVVIAIATVSYQAIKAALANPVKSLRSE